MRMEASRKFLASAHLLENRTGMITGLVISHERVATQYAISQVSDNFFG